MRLHFDGLTFDADTRQIWTGESEVSLSPKAFTPAPFGTYGNLGRGVYNGPGLAEVDLSVLKNIAVTERVNLQFRAEFFNLMNRANYASPNQTVFTNTGTAAAPVYTNNPSAGLISSLTTTPRQIQFGLKLMF